MKLHSSILKKQCNVILIGIVKVVRTGNISSPKNPESTVTIETGDYLLMLMNGGGQEKLKRVFHIEEGPIAERIKKPRSFYTAGPYP